MKRVHDGCAEEKPFWLMSPAPALFSANLRTPIAEKTRLNRFRCRVDKIIPRLFCQTISNGSNAFTVDGGNATNNYFADILGRYRIPYLFGEDAIQEFQVSISPYSAGAKLRARRFRGLAGNQPQWSSPGYRSFPQRLHSRVVNRENSDH
jgi:hypothetical protein